MSNALVEDVLTLNIESDPQMASLEGRYTLDVGSYDKELHVILHAEIWLSRKKRLLS